MVFYVLIIHAALPPVRTLPMNISEFQECGGAPRPDEFITWHFESGRPARALFLIGFDTAERCRCLLSSSRLDLIFAFHRTTAIPGLRKKKNLNNPAQHRAVCVYTKPQLILPRSNLTGEIFVWIFDDGKTPAHSHTLFSLSNKQHACLFQLEMLDIMFYLFRGRAGVCLTDLLCVLFVFCADCERACAFAGNRRRICIVFESRRTLSVWWFLWFDDDDQPNLWIKLESVRLSDSAVGGRQLLYTCFSSLRSEITGSGAKEIIFSLDIFHWSWTILQNILFL